MQKNECYKDHEKLIYKIAWILAGIHNLDPDELFSEFNVEFCKAYNKYEPDLGVKFSSYLGYCCRNRLKNILQANDRLKRKMEVLPDDEYVLNVLSYDPIESVIIYDNFVNNPNKVVRQISKIISVYTMPNTGIKGWLMQILSKDGFTFEEIRKGFSELKTLTV